MIISSSVCDEEEVALLSSSGGEKAVKRKQYKNFLNIDNRLGLVSWEKSAHVFVQCSSPPARPLSPLSPSHAEQRK